LSFAAYTVNEISDIMKGMLKHANAEDLIHPMAVELCARKVSTFGDFRKALDVCRYAFDLLDTELKQQPQSEYILPKVTVKHMVRVGFGFWFSQSSISKLKAFTPNQKTIICRYNRQPEDLPRVETTLLRVYEVYMNIVRKQSAFIAVSRSEFMDLIVGCENAGLISVLKLLLIFTSTKNRPCHQINGKSFTRWFKLKLSVHCQIRITRNSILMWSCA
jgi:cell division control protein 6